MNGVSFDKAILASTKGQDIKTTAKYKTAGILGTSFALLFRLTIPFYFYLLNCA